jgi:hypothetical protein
MEEGYTNVEEDTAFLYFALLLNFQRAPLAMEQCYTHRAEGTAIAYFQ